MTYSSDICNRPVWGSLPSSHLVQPLLSACLYRVQARSHWCQRYRNCIPQRTTAEKAGAMFPVVCAQHGPPVSAALRELGQLSQGENTSVFLLFLKTSWNRSETQHPTEQACAPQLLFVSCSCVSTPVNKNQRSFSVLKVRSCSW